MVTLPRFKRFGEFCGVSTEFHKKNIHKLNLFELKVIKESPSSVMLKKLSFEGTDSDVVLDAELTAAFLLNGRIQCNNKRKKKND